MDSRRDKVKGAINSGVGKAKQAVGRALHDKTLETRGRKQEDKGEIQFVRGDIKEKIRKSSRAVGDAMQKTGKKIRKIA